MDNGLISWIMIIGIVAAVPLAIYKGRNPYIAFFAAVFTLGAASVYYLLCSPDHDSPMQRERDRRMYPHSQRASPGGIIAPEDLSRVSDEVRSERKEYEHRQFQLSQDKKNLHAERVAERYVMGWMGQISKEVRAGNKSCHIYVVSSELARAGAALLQQYGYKATDGCYTNKDDYRPYILVRW